jgi:AcrR family transcriptional regulator
MVDDATGSPARAGRPAGTRHRLQVGERRTQLLELALELFAQRSYDEISIDEIARAAGVSKGLLYHYFKGKREYYVAAIRYAADKLLAITDAVAEQFEDGAEPSLAGLEAGLGVFFGYAERHARTWETLLRGGLGRDVEVDAIVEEVRQHFIARVLLGIGIEGEPPARLRTVVRGWVGGVEAVSLDWLAHRDLTIKEISALQAQALAGSLLALGHTS